MSLVAQTITHGLKLGILRSPNTVSNPIKNGINLLLLDLPKGIQL